MAKKHRIEFNQGAPDLTLLDTDGQPVRLSSLWAERPLLLAFTRHFGCTECKAMLTELTAGRERIQQAGLAIAIVTQGASAVTAAFARRYAPGLPCLADPERKAYRAYGLERGNLVQLFLNPRVWLGITRARKKGISLELPPEGQDARQMSGTFIIGVDGKVELPYYYDHIADHPPLDLLLSGVLSTRWGKSFQGPVGPGAG